MKKLVMLRHGQSVWNKENRFTGWTDVTLSEQGIEEAKKAGRDLKEAGFKFDLAYTSYLKRAIKTCWLALEEMDLMYIPIRNTWKLNEKHYGSLTGLNKSETAAKYGDEQVKLWRRGFDIAPPELSKEDALHPANDSKYAAINKNELPGTESLRDTVDRIVPVWNEIKNEFESKNEILVVAHGNSLRGMLMYIKRLSEAEILEINIPTGIPYVFEFDDQMHLIKDYYLADEETLQQLMNEVANQGKK